MRAREPADALRHLYAWAPELRTMPAAADDPLVPSAARHINDYAHVHSLQARNLVREQQERRAQQVAEYAAWATPVVALGLAFERLAGVGPEAASRYRGFLVDAIDTRARWVTKHAWSKRPLDAADFRVLGESTPATFDVQVSGLPRVIAALVGWALLSWLLAFVALGFAQRRS